MQACLESLKLRKDIASIAFDAVNNFKAVKPDNLEILASKVVEKSLTDHKIGRTGAKLCWELISIETESTDIKSEKIFRKCVLNILQSQFKALRVKNKKKMLAYVTFLCSIFDLYKINGRPLIPLLNPVFECLIQITDLKFARDDETIQCLVTQLQFIGEDLDKRDRDKMDELFAALRELFLSDQSSQLSRLMLLEVIELRGGNWKLSPCAHKYYYGNND